MVYGDSPFCSFIKYSTWSSKRIKSLVLLLVPCCKMKFLLFAFLLMCLSSLALVSARAGCFCTADYAPVCSKSGRTYSNLCRLRCADDSLLHKGACGQGV